MNRETAWRVFAREFNLSSCYVESEGEMSANYVVTPSGGLCNRVFVVGVLIGVEETGGGNDMVRARVSDPTGVFRVYAGRYQPDERDFLLGVEPPSYVAVTGKAGGYRQDDGELLVSVRPEEVVEVDERARVNWVVNTAWRTVERMKAVKMALDSGIEDSSEVKEFLVSQGVREQLARGVATALNHYEIDLKQMESILKEALSSFTDVEFSEEEITPKIAVKKTIHELDTGEGALYSEIIEKTANQTDFDEEDLEHAIEDLLKQGRCYEPEPGQIKII